MFTLFNKFNHVQYREGLGKHCPALTDMETGGLIINADIWPYLSDAEQIEVVSHEEGHWVKKTFDETAADEYALLKQYREGHSLEQAVAAMEKMLDRNNPEHIRRINDRKKLINNIYSQQRNRYKEPTMSNETKGCGCSDCNHNNNYAPYGILGICLSKKCKKAKAEKQATKLELKVERQEANNEAKILLAQQGIKGGIGGFFDGLGDAVGSLAPAVAGIAGGGGILQSLTGANTNQDVFKQTGTALTDSVGNTDAQEQANYNAILQEEEAAKKKKTTTWIIIGAVLLVVTVVAIVLLRKKSV